MTLHGHSPSRSRVPAKDAGTNLLNGTTAGNPGKRSFEGMTTATISSGPMGAAAAAGLTLFFTFFIAATYGFGIYLFPVIMSDMRADLAFIYQQAGVITAASQAGFLVAAFTSGAITPRIGGGRVVVASVAITVACLLGLGVAENIWVIGALLTILGGMAASAYIPMVEVCQRAIGIRHRGKVLGLISSGTAYGVFVNGLLAPYLLANSHWRIIWVTVGAGTGMVLVLAFLYLSTRGLLSGPPPEERAHEPSRPSARVLWQRFKGLLGRKTVVIWTIMLLNGFTCLSFQTYFSAYLRDELGYSAVLAGTLWTVIGFVGMGGGFAMGALADWITIRAAMAVSYLLLALASLLVLLHGDVIMLYAAAGAFGLAFYAIFGLAPAYISRVTTARQSTIVFGIGNILLGFGAMAGNFLGGQLKHMTGTFDWTYILVAAAAFLLVLLTLPLPSERLHGEPAE